MIYYQKGCLGMARARDLVLGEAWARDLVLG